LQSEPGSSLKGAGWKIVGEVNKPSGWYKSRVDKYERKVQEIYSQRKLRWEAQ